MGRAIAAGALEGQEATNPRPLGRCGTARIFSRTRFKVLQRLREAEAGLSRTRTEDDRAGLTHVEPAGKVIFAGGNGNDAALLQRFLKRISIIQLVIRLRPKIGDGASGRRGFR